MPVVPTEQEVLAGRVADFVQAFGGGLNTSPTTAQGQLAASDTAIIGDKNANIALVASMVDPDQAEGAWQDAIGAIYFLERIAAAGSVKTVTCIGGVDVEIPAGSIIKDPSGYSWAATGLITIGSNGQAVGTFQCQTTGPISWPANTPCTIVSSVNGWDQAVSSSDAVLGNVVESRAQFENRRRNSVAINSHGSTASILGNVLAVANVLSAYVVDNPSGTAITVGPTNYSVAPHSVVVSVYGGLASAVAEAIWAAKDAGCGYNGNTSYTVYDTSYPVGQQPSYPVTWLTPTPVPVYFVVTLGANSQLPAAITSDVQTAVVDTFTGEDGSVPAGVYSTISASRYYAGINAIDTSVDIVSVFVGTSTTAVTNESIATANGTTATFTHTVAHLYPIPGTVSVTAGSVTGTDDGNGNIIGAGIAAGSTINYVTGALSVTFTADPANGTAVTTSYTYTNPNTTVQAMGIDQVPTLSSKNVFVVVQ
jgi:hypothetical protein